MLKIVKYLLLLITILIPTLAFPSEIKRIVVIGERTNAPLEFQDINGRPTGLMVDLWKLWSQKTGVEVEYRLTDWAEAMRQVKSGEADAVSVIFFNREREKDFDFTPPYLEVPSSLFYHRDLRGVSSVTDLGGFGIGVLKDDYAEYHLRKLFPQLHLITYPTFSTLVDAAVHGEIKAFVSDTDPAIFHLARHGESGETFVRLPKPLYISEARSAVRKGNEALLSLIIEGRTKITSEELRTVNARWHPVRTDSKLPFKTFMAILAGLSAGAVVLYISNRMLKKRISTASEVLAQTKADLSAKERLANIEELKFRKLMDTMNDGVVIHDHLGRLTYVNQHLHRLLEYEAGEMLGAHASTFVAPEFLGSLPERLSMSSRGLSGSFEMLLRTKSGRTIEALISSSPLPVSDGEEPGTLCIITDVSDLKRTQDLLRAEQAKYRSIFENAMEGIFRMNVDGEYLNVNPAFLRIMGCSPQDCTGEADPCRIRTIRYLDPTRREEFLTLLKDKDVVAGFESQIILEDGSVAWISENARTVRDQDGNILHFEGFLNDITKRKRAEDLLAHQAFHDVLTGLPNRALFLERLGRAIMRSRRRENYLFAVIYMDLDRFKIINDSLGHSAGDELLKSMTVRIGECIRTLDTLSRIGGDEFAVLLEEIESARDCIRIARRIREAIREPLTIAGHEIFSSASMGIVLGPTGYDKAEEVLRDADIAMYRAKDLGKDRFKVFHSQMHIQVLSRMNLESDMRRAIAEQEFVLFYQPIVNLRKGVLKGFEALIRWNHPQRGMVSPAEFVHLAEETGLIIPLGAWVFREACRQLAEFRRLFPTIIPLTMSVNVSPRQFAQPDLSRFLSSCLEEFALPPGSLVLEITEGVIMENPQAATAILRRIKETGLLVSMDDFGTGYSSLSYLHQFPVDLLKIDRSFVSRMDRDPEQLAMVRTIVQLAHILNMEVVAEGIEGLDQLVHLLKQECEYAQGYYFSRPLSMNQLVDKLYLKNGLLAIRMD